MALFRLSRRREGAEWRGHVAGPRVDLPRHLFRARPRAGLITEEQAQEIVDDFVIKLRIVRFLRTPEYDDLFAGDPTWVTESIGGMGDDGRPLVTKTSFRFLQTLYNLGPAPEPNLTIWYSPQLPEASGASRRRSRSTPARSSSKATRSCARPGATTAPSPAASRRCSSASRCSSSAPAPTSPRPALCDQRRPRRDFRQAGRPPTEPVQGDYLDFDDVLERFDKTMDWLAGVYVTAMNVIHYMHDKYAYERIEMALHDYAPLRTMAFGIAGMSVVADSLSAIKYAKVKVIRDETGLIVDYETEGEFPLFGNNDNRVDHMASWLVSTFMGKLRKHPTYRNALHTQSVLTITSNVVYGKATGNTPDGREGRAVRAGRQPDARPRQPRHPGVRRVGGQDSLSRRRRRHFADHDPGAERPGPDRKGPDHQPDLDPRPLLRVTGFHMNINVLNRETLLDAMDHPEKYPSLTIRVSGYAVNFVRLTREQQMDVINRTFHGE
jgi:formate C-acetyltransferase